ncbi:MAG: LexA-binding, inner rane-associated putative hydrolase [Thermoplasmata archaeon]|nr:LexA-binding, inner rane-associated putative hydrolase [Thermoplasmata archaeon]
MSAALTHAAMGLLLGLALRLRGRELPLAAGLALLPDLDHAGLFIPALAPYLIARGTLTNVFTCLLIPVALAAWMRWRDLWPTWQRFALAAPLILASHLLLDMLPLDPLGGVGSVTLFYPVSLAKYTIDYSPLDSLSPATYSTITILLVVLVGMTALTLWVAEGRRLRPTIALAGAWLLVVPAAGVAGAIIQAPAWPDADLSLEAPRLRLPEGAILAVVHDLAGTGFGAGALRLEARAGGTLVATAENPRLDPGGAWVVDAPLTGDARSLGAITVSIVHARTHHAYATARASVEKGHLTLPLSLSPDTPPTRLVARNAGTFAAPAKSLRALATQNGAEVANLTNDAALESGGAWTLPAAGSLAGGLVTWELRAADDGYLYDRQTLAPTLP